mmetsp:Transcript_10463/g.12300  ORF Transcript_10463/g.12300 Transcript_10463/m.12300 type:complete len:245 (+) Transcript_10463:98-832(+)
MCVPLVLIIKPIRLPPTTVPFSSRERELRVDKSKRYQDQNKNGPSTASHENSSKHEYQRRGDSSAKNQNNNSPPPCSRHLDKNKNVPSITSHQNSRKHEYRSRPDSSVTKRNDNIPPPYSRRTRLQHPDYKGSYVSILKKQDISKKETDALRRPHKKVTWYNQIRAGDSIRKRQHKRLPVYSRDNVSQNRSAAATACHRTAKRCDRRHVRDSSSSKKKCHDSPPAYSRTSALVRNPLKICSSKR